MTASCHRPSCGSGGASCSPSASSRRRHVGRPVAGSRRRAPRSCNRLVDGLAPTAFTLGVAAFEVAGGSLVRLGSSHDLPDTGRSTTSTHEACHRSSSHAKLRHGLARRGAYG